MDVFDFVNSINNTKKNLYKEEPNADKYYVPYVVNKAFSYFLDTVLRANFMNMQSSLSKKMQYEYYLHSVTKGKRYSKWHKNDKNEEVIDVIKKYYECSDKKAREYITILSDQQIEELRSQLNIGKYQIK